MSDDGFIVTIIENDYAGQEPPSKDSLREYDWVPALRKNRRWEVEEEIFVICDPGYSERPQLISWRSKNLKKRKREPGSTETPTEAISTSSVQWSLLPTDVLVFVVSPYLDASSLLFVRQTSKLWKSAVEKYIGEDRFGIREFGKMWHETFKQYLSAADMLYYCAMIHTVQEAYFNKTTSRETFKLTEAQLMAITLSPLELKDYQFTDTEDYISPKACFKACIERHKNIENLRLYKKKLIARQAKKEQNMEARHKELAEALHAVHLTNLPISPFCTQWIKYPGKCKRAGLSLDSIVRKCCEEKYLDEPSEIIIANNKRFEEQTNDSDVTGTSDKHYYDCRFGIVRFPVDYGEDWPWIPKVDEIPETKEVKKMSRKKRKKANS